MELQTEIVKLKHQTTVLPTLVGTLPYYLIEKPTPGAADLFETVRYALLRYNKHLSGFLSKCKTINLSEDQMLMVDWLESCRESLEEDRIKQSLLFAPNYLKDPNIPNQVALVAFSSDMIRTINMIKGFLNILSSLK